MTGFNFDQSAALTASTIGSGMLAVGAYACPKDMHSKLFTSVVHDEEVRAGWAALASRRTRFSAIGHPA